MDHTSSLKTIFASLQWLFFIFANTVVVSVSIGTAFGLDSAEIAAMLRCSLIFTGVACVLQGMFGHRYPLMEGHSGVMWGFGYKRHCSAMPFFYVLVINQTPSFLLIATDIQRILAAGGLWRSTLCLKGFLRLKGQSRSNSFHRLRCPL